MFNEAPIARPNSLLKSCGTPADDRGSTLVRFNSVRVTSIESIASSSSSVVVYDLRVVIGHGD